MSLPLFHQPVASLCGDIEIDLIGRNIKPSLALRKAGGTTRSMGGTLVYGPTYRELGYDSGLELDWIMQLTQDPFVTEVASQHVRTSYFDSDGVKHHTIWDLYVSCTDGSRELTSVKRHDVAISDAFQEKWKWICEGVPPGIADTARIVTEVGIEPAKVDMGKLFNKALAGGQPKGAEPVFEFIVAQQKPVAISAACDFLRAKFPVPEQKHFHARSGEFWAVVWLLAKRAIMTSTDGILTMQSKVVLS